MEIFLERISKAKFHINFLSCKKIRMDLKFIVYFYCLAEKLSSELVRRSLVNDRMECMNALNRSAMLPHRNITTTSCEHTKRLLTDVSV